MSTEVAPKEWAALLETLNTAIKSLDSKKSDTVRENVADFCDKAATLWLEDLIQVADRFDAFVAEAVGTEWNTEAAATLSFAMGALAEKMQTLPYGPEFSSGLKDVLLFLDYYAEEEAEPETPTDSDAQAPPPSTPSLDVNLTITSDTPEDLPATSPQAPSGQDITQVNVDSAASEAVETLTEPLETSQPSTEEEFERVTPPTRPELRVEPPATTPVGLETESDLPPSARDGHEERKPSPLEPAESVEYVMDLVDWYTELLRHDPTSQIFALLAEEYCDRHMWKEAVHTCRNGLVYHPRHLRGSVLLGWALWELGEVEEAEHLLLFAKSELDKNAVVYRILSELAKGKGDSNLLDQLDVTSQKVQLQVGKPTLPSKNAASLHHKPEPKAPPILGLMHNFLEKLEDAPGDLHVKSEIFTDRDRKTLRQMLYNYVESRPASGLGI